jgi:hydroxyacylglutathione hydrolase
MLERLTVGPIGENAYVIGSDDACILVDPGDEAPRILAFLDSRDLVPSLIVATHGHLDHTAAVPELIDTWRSRGLKVPLAAHAADAPYFGPDSEETNRLLFSSIKATGYFKHYWRPIPALDLLLADGELLPGAAYRVIHSPGHSRGSICLYDEASSLLIAGDTLFRGGVGRTDGFDADGSVLEASLRRLFALPASTRVFPGHGEDTTIGRESGILG